MNIKFKDALTLLSTKATNWYEMIVKSIPNIILGLIVFILFIFIAKLAKSILGRLLPRLTKNITVINLLKTVGSFLILVIGLFVALEIMNLEKTVTSILAGAGVIGLALGFAFQEIASNFVSGILIAFREPYQIGDIVELNDFFGEVTQINLRTTSIMTFQGLEVLVPNKDLFTEPFINFTTTPKRRVDIKVGVSYGDDLNKVERVTKEALEEIEERCIGKDIQVYYTDFGSSSINLVAHIWITYTKNISFLKARHQAIINIKEAYDKNDISIPFPIRTIDFGIKGGKELGEIDFQKDV